MSRVNFFKQIDLVYDENFQRKDSKGVLVEITDFNKNNDCDITTNIIDILRENCQIDESVYHTLDHCLMELLDNVARHSESPIDGITMAQTYKNKNCIKLVVIDNGKGIHNSLTQPPKSKFKHFSEPEALERCLEKGVTNGLGGMGNGLFHTSSFIRLNKGEMTLYSGGHCLILGANGLLVQKAPFWQGTILAFNINTNIYVDHKEFMGSHRDLSEDFKEVMGYYSNEDDAALW